MNFRGLFLNILLLSVLAVGVSHPAETPQILPDLPAGSSSGVVRPLMNSIYLDLGSVSSTNSMDGYSYSPGYHFSLGNEFGISPGFSVVLDADYNFYNLNTSSFSDAVGGGLHTLLLSLNGKFNFNPSDDPVVFYTLAGLGPVLTIIDPGTYASSGFLAPIPGINELDFGIRFGLGLDFRLDRTLALSTEWNLTDIFTN